MLSAAKHLVASFSLLLATLACTPPAKQSSAVRSSPRQSAVRQVMPVYRVARDVYRTEPSLHHADYLALGVAHAPIAALKTQIEAREGVTLLDRGEAHITTITPPEFQRLSTKMTMADIEFLARDNGFYEAKFEIACLGRAMKENAVILSEAKDLDEAPSVDKTYFLVVRSPQISNVRRIIAKEFQARGGAADAFAPERFSPHITIGYTRRDLHEADGVVKDATSCIGGVRLVDGLLTQ